MKKFGLILIGAIILGFALRYRYDQLNAVPNLKLFARHAVDFHQTREEYRRSLASEPRIFAHQGAVGDEQIFAQADYPFQPLPVYLQIAVRFKNGKAVSFAEQEMGAAL